MTFGELYKKDVGLIKPDQAFIDELTRKLNEQANFDINVSEISPISEINFSEVNARKSSAWKVLTAIAASLALIIGVSLALPSILNNREDFGLIGNYDNAPAPSADNNNAYYDGDYNNADMGESAYDVPEAEEVHYAQANLEETTKQKNPNYPDENYNGDYNNSPNNAVMPEVVSDGAGLSGDEESGEEAKGLMAEDEDAPLEITGEFFKDYSEAFAWDKIEFGVYWIADDKNLPSVPFSNFGVLAKRMAYSTFFPADLYIFRPKETMIVIEEYSPDGSSAMVFSIYENGYIYAFDKYDVTLSLLFFKGDSQLYEDILDLLTAN